MSQSKKLGHDDVSGFEFAKEMLSDDITAAINFDRIQYSSKDGYIIFEYLLCEDEQNVTPYSSHPKKYWNKNKMKFIRLWQVSKDLNATLYLVNYAKKGTKAENEILLIHVLDMNDSGIQKEEITRFTRSEFQAFFRTLNKQCLEDSACITPQHTEELLCPRCKHDINLHRYNDSSYYCCTESCGMDVGRLFGKVIPHETVIDLIHGYVCRFEGYYLFPDYVSYQFNDDVRYCWKWVKIYVSSK